MSSQTLQASPATVIFSSPTRDDELWVADQVAIEKLEHPGENSPPYILLLRGRGEERIWPVALFESTSRGEWAGTLYADDVVGPGLTTFYARTTTQRDAEWAVNLDNYPNIPLPVKEIWASISVEGAFMSTQPELYAVMDDDTYVGTILLSAETGLYVRYAAQWHEVTDPNLIEDKTVHLVTPASVAIFDEAEQSGEVLPVSDYMVGGYGAPIGSRADRSEDTEDVEGTEDAIAASGSSLHPPKLSCVEDVPTAILAATESTILQWWVERRLSALGIEADLPWKQ